MFDFFGDVQCVGPGQQKYGDIRGRVAANLGKGAVGLLAQFHPGDVSNAHNLRFFRAARALDDDILELLDIGQTAKGVDGELEHLVGRHRRTAHLSGYDLHILALDGVDHVQGGQVEILELFGVQPDPHAVRAGALDNDLAHPGQASQGIFQIDDRVVGQKGGVVPVIFR